MKNRSIEDVFAPEKLEFMQVLINNLIKGKHLQNRKTVERQKFNETAREYNTYIRQFPKNILSGIFGFERKAYFEAAEGADTAPKVEF